MTTTAWAELDYKIQTRPHPELGIGVIGIGGIARHAHLPAYRSAGFSVVALASRNPEAVEQAGADFGVPHRYTDYRELLANDAVKIVDIAIPGEARLEVARAAAAAGKHLLIQKPLANTLEEAREIVQLAREAGVTLAVNQQARWAPVYRATRSLIAQGFLGEVYDITHDMRNAQDGAEFFRNAWNAREPRYQIVQYSIHYLDIMRFWMAREPDYVLAHTIRKPGQFGNGEMMCDLILQFGSQAQALITDRNACWHERPYSVQFSVEGTHGMVEGDVANNTIRVRHRDHPGAVWEPELEGNWFPDAFAGTMGELLDAVAEGRPTIISGEDNLHSMALVEAAYQSAAELRAIMPTV